MIQQDGFYFETCTPLVRFELHKGAFIICVSMTTANLEPRWLDLVFQ